jgi:hypothetical protein
MKPQTLLILFLLLNSLGILNSQVINDVMKKPHFYQLDNGYMVYGMGEKNFEIKIYDENLNLKEEYSNPLQKGESGKNSFIYDYGEMFFITTKFCRYTFKNNGEYVDKHTWSKDEFTIAKNSVDGKDIEDYSPHGLYGNTWPYGRDPGIYKGNIFIEFSDNEIRFFEVKSKGVYLTHKLLKTISINGKVDSPHIQSSQTFINDWHRLNNSIYLNLRTKGSSLLKLVKINTETMSIDSEIEFKFPGIKSTYLSHIIPDNLGGLIVVGNYTSGTKGKMEGWFISTLDSSMKMTNYKTYTMDSFKLKKCDGILFKKIVKFDNTIRIVGESLILSQAEAGDDIITPVSIISLELDLGLEIVDQKIIDKELIGYKMSSLPLRPLQSGGSIPFYINNEVNPKNNINQIGIGAGYIVSKTGIQVLIKKRRSKGGYGHDYEFVTLNKEGFTNKIVFQNSESQDNDQRFLFNRNGNLIVFHTPNLKGYELELIKID